MITSRSVLAAVAGLAASIPFASAGYNPNSQSNYAVYWGQNSINQGGANGQQRLSYYCQQADVDIILLAFLNLIVNPTTVNFANAGDRCTAIAGTGLLRCPEIEADIKTCQAAGKTILLSIGGATYTEGGFSSNDAAVSAANKVWDLFGPNTGNSQRPFGSAVVDGFDLDFEAAPTRNMPAFANRLRTVMDNAGGKKYYLTAAPQCPYPDAANNEMLAGAVSFDFLMVQFYNNYCGVNSFQVGSSSQFSFNMDTWDNWARTVSKNRNVKVLVGAPASPGAGGGYVPVSTLSSIIGYSKQFSSFGGVMIWDASQAWANGNFVGDLGRALGDTSTPPPTSTAKPPQSTTLRTTTKPPTQTPTPPTNGGQPQWAQCGGKEYTGPTQCASPFNCVCTSDWWCHCN